ncbi:MAG: hypothetical protein IKR73_04375, partial [Oscillospiraceae bacterium]|nr:hypothetical protein [Oscillospiraceae bacterium]
RETYYTDPPGHIPGERVILDEQGPSCVEPGWRHCQICCTVCGVPLEEGTDTIDPLGHLAGEAVEENFTAPTCTQEGYYEAVTYCERCGEELSREPYIIPAGHTPGEPVIENETAATYAEQGSYDEVVCCSVCGEEISRETKTTPRLVELAGCSLTLKDDIGLNIHFTMADEVVNDPTAKMVITLPNGDVTETASSQFVKKDGMYEFRANVAAREMNDKVHCALYAGDDGEPKYEADVSVRDAADMYLSHPEDYSNEQGIVKAMLNYGAYSQEYFGSSSEPANYGLEEDDTDVSSVTAEDRIIQGYQRTVTGLPEGVTFYGSTLSLKSKTELVLLFDVKGKQKLTFMYEGQELPNKNYQGHRSCRISGIDIEDMGKDITVYVNDTPVQFSPLAHCYDALVLGNTDDEALTKWQNVIRALYLYYDAAKDHPGDDSNG